MADSATFQDDTWGNSDALNGIMQNILDQNQPWVDAAKDADQKAAREQKLNDRLAKVMDAYNYYGPSAFQSKKSDLDIPWQQNSYTGSVPNSPLASNATGLAAPKDSSNPPLDLLNSIIDRSQKFTQAAGDPTGQGLEAVGTGVAAALLAGLAGVGQGMANAYNNAGIYGEGVELPNQDTSSNPSPADVTNQVQQNFTAQPTTEQGQQAAEGLSGILNIPGEIGQAAGNTIIEAGQTPLTDNPLLNIPIRAKNAIAGSPLAATVADVLPQMIGPEEIARGVVKPFSRAKVPDIDPDMQAGLDKADEIKSAKVATDPDIADAVKSASADKDFSLNKEFLKETPDTEGEADTKVTLADHGFTPEEIKTMADKGMADPDGTMDREQFWNYKENKDQLPDFKEVPEPPKETIVPPVDTSVEADTDEGQSAYAKALLEDPSLSPEVREVLQQKVLPEQEKTAPVEDEDESREARRQRLLAQATGLEEPVANAPELVGGQKTGVQLHPDTTSDLINGKLTVGSLFDSIADNKDGHYDAAPEAVAYTQLAREAAKNLGGSNVKMEMFDPTNPEHLDIQKRSGSDTWSGIYDPKTNKVVIRGRGNAQPSTLVHEGVHAVTQRALAMGQQGMLEGKARDAYNTLSNLFETLKPHLSELSTKRTVEATKAGASPASISRLNRMTRYGTTDLHELISETFSNKAFREHLKSLKLDSLDQAKLGLGRTVVGKVRNMYEAVTKSIRNLLGLSPKADNALDAIVSASHDFMNSFTPKEAEGLRKNTMRNTDPLKLEEEEGNQKRYKPMVTDPLSEVQKKGAVAKSAINRLVTNRAPEGSPYRDIRRAGEEARGAIDAARVHAEDVARGVDKAQKAENTPDRAVTDYLSKKDPNALDNYPKTKAAADAFDKGQNGRTQQSQKLATLLLKDPNISDHMLDFADHVLNNPGYINRSYQPEGYTRDVLRTARAVDDVLSKNPSATLSAPQKKAKAIVDNVKQWIKDNLLPTEDMSHRNLTQMRNIARNMGLNPTDITRGTAQGAKHGVLEKAIKEAVPGWETGNTDHIVNQLLHEVAGVVSADDRVVAKYYRGARLGDILTEREQIPPQLKALWGEVHKPSTNMVNTQVKQAMGIAHLEQQYRLLEAGKKNGWINDHKFEDRGFDTRIKGIKYGPLRNHYVPNEVYQMLRSHVELSTAANNFMTALWSGNAPKDLGIWALNKAGETWRGAVTGYKLFSMATNQAYWMMYGFGGPFIMLSHGIVNPMYALRGLGAHLAEISPMLRRMMANSGSSIAKQITNDHEILRRNGMIESSQVGETFTSQQARQLKEALENGKMNDVMGMVRQTLGKVINAPTKYGTQILSLADGYAKRGAFLQRVDVKTSQAKRLGLDTDPGQIERDAADHVKDTTITFGRTPVLSRIFEQYGLSKGLPYVTETVRNAWNAGMHGFGDMIDGYKNNDPVMVAHGTKQVLGTITAVGGAGKIISGVVGTGIATMGLVSQLVAPDDKRQKMMQEKGSKFRGSDVEQISDPDKKNSYMWTPGDTESYYYQLQELYNTLGDVARKHAAGEKIDYADELSKAAGAFTGTWLRAGLTTNLMNIAAAKTPSWLQNAPNLNDEQYAFWKNKFGLTDDNVKRMQALTDMAKPGFVKNDQMAAESPGSDAIKTLIRAGFKVTAVPNDAGLSDKTAGQIKSQLVTAKEDLAKTLTSTAPLTDEAIKGSFERAFKETSKVYTKLSNAEQYAEGSGLKKSQAMNAMYEGKIPETGIEQVATGRMNPAESLYNDLNTSMEEAYQKYADDPDKRKVVMDQYKHRIKLVGQMVREYIKLTPQQIEDMQ